MAQPGVEPGPLTNRLSVLPLHYCTNVSLLFPLLGPSFPPTFTFWKEGGLTGGRSADLSNPVGEGDPVQAFSVDEKGNLHPLLLPGSHPGNSSDQGTIPGKWNHGRRGGWHSQGLNRGLSLTR